MRVNLFVWQQPWQQRLHRRRVVAIAAVCLLAVLLRWPSLDLPFDNDSGAIAYHARLIVAGEPLYGSHHPAHHLPAVYYVYALAFALFGDSVWAVKFWLILWTVLIVYLLYRLGVLVAGELVGLLAAVFYAVLSAHVYLFGMTAEIELFANLPRVGAVLVLLHLASRRAPAWKFFWVGLLSALAILFKIVYLSPLAVMALVLLQALWRNRTQPEAWREFFRRSRWAGIGILAGFLPVIVYFGYLGLLPRLFLVFTLGQQYVGASAEAPTSHLWILYPLLPLYGLAYNNAALLIYGLGAFCLVWMSRPERQSLLAVIAAWLFFSFLEAGINLQLYPHYYLLIVPPLTLLAAWFLVKVYYQVRQRSPASRPAAAGLFIILLGIALSLSVAQNYAYYSYHLQYRLGQTTFEEFLRRGWPGFGERLARSLVLSDYVRAHTAPDDHVFYWSEDVQLYYQAERLSPVDVLWPVYVEATGAGHQVFGPTTVYVIVDRQRHDAAPAWLVQNLAEQYALETVIEAQEVYRRAPE